MAEQQPGLRFDIYERVHLNEGLAAIRELNDVELVPHIQVLSQNNQALLKGSLQLTGSYIGEQEQEPFALEHMIPVEITLPMNRVQRVEDILVEIENFDVDLLSSRSLNITGVLSLQGIEIASADSESWRDEEEVVFVQEAQGMRVEPVPVAPEPEPAPVQVQPTEVEVVNEAPALVEMEAEKTEKTELTVISDAAEEQTTAEEKKELKLAFGKKADEAVEIKPYGIKSLLQKASSIFQTDKRKEDKSEEAEAASDSKTDALEWKRLFLNTESPGQEFRRVRMCIVQKEETLETIAKRYELNPRELQLLNRLSEPEVSAGQIIYLPK